MDNIEGNAPSSAQASYDMFHASLEITMLYELGKVASGGLSKGMKTSTGIDDINKSEQAIDDLGESLKFETNTKSAKKLAKQMEQRGWTQDSVRDVVNNPYTTRESQNLATRNKATAYYDRNGNYVIIDNETKEVIQVSKKGDKTWKPDKNIKDPFISN